MVLESLSEHVRRFPPGPEQLLCTNSAGRPVSRSSFGETWRKVTDAAGLGAGVRMHDLRHYYASSLIRHGESVRDVQSRLGHSSAGETIDTYMHLWPDSEGRTRAGRRSGGAG